MNNPSERLQVMMAQYAGLLEPKAKTTLYKSELCKSLVDGRPCMYGDKCQFAHSVEEIREPLKPINYKTRECYNFANGFCKHGEKCRFIHGPNDPDARKVRDGAFIPDMIAYRYPMSAHMGGPLPAHPYYPVYSPTPGSTKVDPERDAFPMQPIGFYPSHLCYAPPILPYAGRYGVVQCPGPSPDMSPSDGVHSPGASHPCTNEHMEKSMLHFARSPGEHVFDMQLPSTSIHKADDSSSPYDRTVKPSEDVSAPQYESELSRTAINLSHPVKPIPIPSDLIVLDDDAISSFSSLLKISDESDSTSDSQYSIRGDSGIDSHDTLNSHFSIETCTELYDSSSSTQTE